MQYGNLLGLVKALTGCSLATILSVQVQEEHDCRSRKVLERINLILNPSKCEFKKQM